MTLLWRKSSISISGKLLFISNAGYHHPLRARLVVATLPKLNSVVKFKTMMTSASLGNFKVPLVNNESMRQYAPGSKERADLQATIKEMQGTVHQVPCIVNGEKVRNSPG